MKSVNYENIARDILIEQIGKLPPTQRQALSDAFTLIEEAWTAAEEAIQDFEDKERIRLFIAALERLQLMGIFREIMKAKEAENETP